MSVLGSALVTLLLLHARVGSSWLGVAMGSVLLGKVVVADRYRTGIAFARPWNDVRVCAVMPLHNEDPAFAVAGVASMLAQSRPIDRIHVVDDGSTDDGRLPRSARTSKRTPRPVTGR